MAFRNTHLFKQNLSAFTRHYETESYNKKSISVPQSTKRSMSNTNNYKPLKTTPPTTMAAYDVDDFSIVYRLCSSVKKEEDWDDIRVFLRSNPTEVTKACAEYQGELETSSLHVACKNNPPLDVIQALYEASPEAVEWIDAFVWLPLHYAAANGASAEVLSFLTNADPTSKVAVDKRGRTPLHFAVGTLDRQASKEVVEILSDSGAARCADENGSLPIHYACAYSSSVEVLKVLVEAVPQSSSSIDFNGCTPLHFAVSASYFGSNSLRFAHFY